MCCNAGSGDRTRWVVLRGMDNSALQVPAWLQQLPHAVRQPNLRAGAA